MNRCFPIFQSLIIIGLLICSGNFCHGQEVLKKDFPTKKVNKRTRENKTSNKPKEKKISYIYTRKARKVLYGNPCALAVTRKMGFEFALEEKAEDDSRTYYRRLKNNFLVKTRLFFTRGPFWRLVVNKRIKDCAQMSGDQVG